MSGIALYKLANKGTQTRTWKAAHVGDGIINVEHGVLNGKMQTEITRCAGKNIGRSNETTAEQQAEQEVIALYTKKLNRDNYKYNLADSDALLEPMLALDYSKVPHRVPDGVKLWRSPKLDGNRAVWRPDFGLQSRKGLSYNVPHILEALTDCDITLDGEFYLHGVPLNRITSATKKHNELTDMLEFHVFDVVSDETDFAKRYETCKNAVSAINSPFVKLVEQVVCTKADIKQAHDYYVQQGFEGVMIRVDGFPYENKRSASLFKYKEFLESEFLITDVKLDKDGGAVLTCGSFDVRCRGTDDYRLYQAQNPDLFIGKQLTVRYFSITEFGEPQFPVGVVVRDYE